MPQSAVRWRIAFYAAGSTAAVGWQSRPPGWQSPPAPARWLRRIWNVTRRSDYHVRDMRVRLGRFAKDYRNNDRFGSVHAV